MARARSERDAGGGLTLALREARLAEAAHFEAALHLRDSKSIRLQLLKDDLIPTVAGHDTARELFDLALIQSEPPRLWIDLISHVVMEPDHRTYRFQQDRQDNRETLFESDDRAAMADYIRRHMAHRLIQRERQAAQQTLPLPIPAGYSTASLMLAWTAGFAFGALVLLGTAIYLGQLGN